MTKIWCVCDFSRLFQTCINFSLDLTFHVYGIIAPLQWYILYIDLYGYNTYMIIDS